MPGLDALTSPVAKRFLVSLLLAATEIILPSRGAAILPDPPVAAITACMPSKHPASVSIYSPTGVIVPLYSYPGTGWDDLIQVKTHYPRVPMIAVVDPENGPGSGQDASYVRGIHDLRSSGISVLGYVYTSYAARSMDSVMADIDMYRRWYDLDGFFFDEMSSISGNEGYYSSLDRYVKSLGYQMTVGNPAVDTLLTYVDTVDTLVIYEDAGLPDSSSFGGWHTGYATQHFALIAHSVADLDLSFVIGASKSVGYLYLTDDVPPNPYDVLPGYFRELVAVLNALPSSASGEVGAWPPGHCDRPRGTS